MPTPSNNLEYPEELQAILEEILGTKNVYFQPPSSKKMNYPCIVYQLDNVDSRYADNRTYKMSKRYLLTYIDSKPDMYIPDKLALILGASFSRYYVSDSLNHYAYRLTFDSKPNN